MAESTQGEVYALDVSDAAYTVQENVADLPNCHAVQGDLMDAPFEDDSFDFIIADGVLHHTPNTREGVEALYRKLRAGGQMFFYVYKRMGPIRQFTDDYVRERFTQLSPEECYQACEGFTELGKALGDLRCQVHLDKGIPLLGIPAGTHDVQRLIYYSVLKCFWNDAFDAETNNMVNFDWYHPHHAWQHTREEIEGWLNAIEAKDYSFQDANPNGLSVLVRKQ
jgi:SAM-dependent methyltransferase